MNIPCHNCPDRKLHCHDQCKDYIDFRNNRYVVSEKRHQNRMINEYFATIAEKIDRFKRSHD